MTVPMQLGVILHVNHPSQSSSQTKLADSRLRGLRLRSVWSTQLNAGFPVLLCRIIDSVTKIRYVHQFPPFSASF